jgi:hypothetical protein
VVTLNVTISTGKKRTEALAIWGGSGRQMELFGGAA